MLPVGAVGKRLLGAGCGPGTSELTLFRLMQELEEVQERRAAAGWQLGEERAGGSSV